MGLLRVRDAVVCSLHVEPLAGTSRMLWIALRPTGFPGMRWFFGIECYMAVEDPALGSMQFARCSCSLTRTDTSADLRELVLLCGPSKPWDIFCGTFVLQLNYLRPPTRTRETGHQ